MKVLVYLKKRSNYTNRVLASCFHRTGAFSDVLKLKGENHVYKGRLLSVSEFNADVDIIFSERMIAKLSEVPKVRIIDDEPVAAPKEEKESEPVATIPVEKPDSSPVSDSDPISTTDASQEAPPCNAAMAAAAAAAEPPSSDPKAKNKSRK